MKKIDEFLTENIDKAFQLTSMVKYALACPGAVLVTALVPGNWDEQLRLRMLAAFETALKYLQWLKDGQALTDASFNDLKQHYNDATKEVKDAFLIKVASLVTKDLDRRYSTNVYDAAVQIKYSLEKA